MLKTHCVVINLRVVSWNLVMRVVIQEVIIGDQSYMMRVSPETIVKVNQILLCEYNAIENRTYR